MSSIVENYLCNFFLRERGCFSLPEKWKGVRGHCLPAGCPVFIKKLNRGEDS